MLYSLPAEPRDLVFVLRPDGTNPHAARQFARVLKHGLRIQGLRCVDAREVPTFPADAARSHRDPEP
jgi:hypothetical protein